LQIKWCVINRGFPISKINQNGPVQFFLYAVSKSHLNTTTPGLAAACLQSTAAVYSRGHLVLISLWLPCGLLVFWAKDCITVTASCLHISHIAAAVQGVSYS
jgi:hypothetical protein